MAKQHFEPGSSTVEGFFNFMRERHRIYLKRFTMDQPKPWTDDPIFQQWKFTNVFRQLDHGTRVLHMALRHERDFTKIVWNVWWYRLFNWHEHMTDFGVLEHSTKDYSKLINGLKAKAYRGDKVFTSAHMTTGVFAEDKVDTYIRAVKHAADYAPYIADIALSTQSMERVFEELLEFYMIGKFVSYEIVCDLRFFHGFEPTDAMTWANIGPGAKRGLRRLGKSVDLDNMIALMNQFADEEAENIDGPFYPHMFCSMYPPFELREIEHSLCEFDKYERIRLGQGRPRQKYKGI